MYSRLRKPLLVAVCALLAAFALSACGDSHTKVSTGTYAGESGVNAPYLDVGPLVYEVQLSRELNPANSEDASYLEGLSEAERKLEPGQEWFAVFMQVYNNGSSPETASDQLTISDTQGNVYEPIAPSATNAFAYRAGTVPAKGQLPILDTTANSGPSQGSLLLFKIQVVSLDNRPLELKIVDPTDPTEMASAELDV
ncbi:MAG TPA: hypothetical protein VH025_03385 [Solirubrobacteraceae bacterium]|jgi:hypothetical protein|nr:hypothetical protein [Solirubrobacteraceae bacterium]